MGFVRYFVENRHLVSLVEVCSPKVLPPICDPHAVDELRYLDQLGCHHTSLERFRELAAAERVRNQITTRHVKHTTHNGCR